MSDKSKEYVIVGGSNGIGLALAKKLIKKGYFIYILDILEPNDLKEDINCYEYHFFDLMDLDFNELERLRNRKAVQGVFITAGIGRVAAFEQIHSAEIKKVLTINTVATIQIIRAFYDRINNSEPFYCGVMGSIAGMVSSPLFSIYAASKAAVVRFIESVNIELEERGIINRILNVSPGAIKGTCFYGGENELSLTESLAKEIVQRLFDREEIFIPDYTEIYKDVLDRYHDDAKAFGKSSYQYKWDSGRLSDGKKIIIGYLSGTFDLFHIGHLNLLKKAKKCCDYLIVGVHPNAKHKGKETFIPFEERKSIVGACKYVDQVVESCLEDSDAWDLWQFDRLFVGSDYKGTERFNRYEQYFSGKNVEIVYFPYTQGTSSTQIRQIIIDKQ